MLHISEPQHQKQGMTIHLQVWKSHVRHVPHHFTPSIRFSLIVFCARTFRIVNPQQENQDLLVSSHHPGVPSSWYLQTQVLSDDRACLLASAGPCEDEHTFLVMQWHASCIKTGQEAPHGDCCRCDFILHLAQLIPNGSVDHHTTPVSPKTISCRCKDDDKTPQDLGSPAEEHAVASSNILIFLQCNRNLDASQHHSILVALFFLFIWL